MTGRRPAKPARVAVAGSRRILVGYVTRSGYTRTVAQAIAKNLTEHGHLVELADLELCLRRPAEYDAVVLGAPIRFGHHSDAIKTFIAENREALSGRPSAFFSVDKNAYRSRSPDPAGHLEKLFAEVGWRPARAIAIAGKIDYREHTWARRIMMRLASKRRGAPTDTSRDHVLTDWTRVASFCEQLSRDLAPRISSVRSPSVAPS